MAGAVTPFPVARRETPFTSGADVRAACAAGVVADLHPVPQDVKAPQPPARPERALTLALIAVLERRSRLKRISLEVRQELMRRGPGRDVAAALNVLWADDVEYRS